MTCNIIPLLSVDTRIKLHLVNKTRNPFKLDEDQMDIYFQVYSDFNSLMLQKATDFV